MTSKSLIISPFSHRGLRAFLNGILGSGDLGSAHVEHFPQKDNSNDEPCQCYDFVNFLYAGTAISTVIDLILCTVPLRFLWSLKIPKKQKVVVSLLFFVGGL